MRHLIFIGLILFAGFKAFEKYQGGDFNLAGNKDSATDTPDIVSVYGRDTCSITNQTISDLRAANIRYRYHNIDREQIADNLHERMKQQGLNTRRYNLPVVNINGQLYIRPHISKIKDRL